MSLILMMSDVRELQSREYTDPKPVEIAPFGWLSRHEGGSAASYASDLAEAVSGEVFECTGLRVIRRAVRAEDYR